MKKAVTISLLLLAALIGVTLAAYYIATVPQTATIPIPIPLTVTMEITIDSLPYTSGTPIDWGNDLLINTEYERPITIKNTGTATFTITYTPLSIPAGWTQTLELDSTTLAPQTTATGILTITTASTPGDFSWGLEITATEV